MPIPQTPPEPKKRPGDKAERLDFVRRLLAQGKSDSEVARLTTEKFGVKTRQAARHIADVRELHRKNARALLTPEVICAHRSEQMEMVRQVIEKAWTDIAQVDRRERGLRSAIKTAERIRETLMTFEAAGGETAEDMTALLGALVDLGAAPVGRNKAPLLRIVLRAVQLMADLTGTAPQKIEVKADIAGPAAILEQMSDAELDSFLLDQGVQLRLVHGGKAPAGAGARG